MHRILEHTGISEIKTQESLYDLFDLINVAELDVYADLTIKIKSTTYPFTEQLSSASSMTVENEEQYPLRTIHFRKDFKIAIDNDITIEKVQIKREFWLSIDKNICWSKRLPFSYFHGVITSEQVMLRPLYFMLLDETRSLDHNDKEVDPIFEVIDDIADAINEERCFTKYTKEELIAEMEANIVKDGYELNESNPEELRVATLLYMSAMNLVYAANVKATYITKGSFAEKLEGMSYVYLKYAINKAINAEVMNNTIESILHNNIDPTGVNATNFITSAYYNYFNSETKYSIDVKQPLSLLFELLTQIPVMPKFEA